MRKPHGAAVVVLVATLLAAGGARPARAFDQQLLGFLSLRGVATDDERSWLRGGLGKLRFDHSDEPLAFGTANLTYRAHLSPTLGLHASATAYGGGNGTADLDEAFVEWKPVPRSAWHWQARGGAFHAPFSLENTGVGWTSPYTISSSAVNEWFGDELRTVGVEAQATHAGAPSGSPHDLSLLGGLFRANDPAGALIAWRGWGLGDRQTGLSETLPLANLPAFTDSGSFPPQGDFERPFREIDQRTGWYGGVQWDFLQRSRLRVQHYDNRGDPGALTLAGQQWTWRTTFDHVAWHLRLPADTELLAQRVWGETEMDGFTGPLVYAKFRAAYVLLSHQMGDQRASVRYDRFAVDDRDSTPDDPNAETGHAWTAAWFWSGRPGARGGLRLGAEAMQVTSWRPARKLLGDAAQQRERLLQLVAEWRF